MDFISNQEAQIKSMLEAIGCASIDELFSVIPQRLRLAKPEANDGLSEWEGMRFMENIASKNSYAHFTSYLGGGAYEHHVPALVGAICSKSEFLTSYTPYQAEISQGMLQAIFEFQSAICALTGMDAANASLYDAATACAEAVLMALRIHRDRNKVVISRSMHPHYRAVVEQYLASHGTLIDWIPVELDGTLDFATAVRLIDDRTAAVLLQSPNFFGVIEDYSEVAKKAKSYGALTIICADLLSYGLYVSGADLGADIAVGDTQSLGLPLQFGGPYAGYLGCREEFLRQMPGRIVGETVDLEGRRGFILTLQAREQHIRRDKATSNICTNEALAALASLVAILWYGKEGLKKLALMNYQRTAYLKSKLEKITGIKVMGRAPFFNEFIIFFEDPLKEVFKHFLKQGIIPGLDIGRFYPELDGGILVAVTETKSKAMLDQYVEAAATIGNRERAL